MGNQGCWVEAGMLVLPRGTHLLPICVFARLAGTPSATDRLLHVCASNVNEASVRQHCWCCCTFETMLANAMAVVRAHGLSTLIRTPVALHTGRTSG